MKATTNFQRKKELKESVLKEEDLSLSEPNPSTSSTRPSGRPQRNLGKKQPPSSLNCPELHEQSTKKKPKKQSKKKDSKEHKANSSFPRNQNERMSIQTNESHQNSQSEFPDMMRLPPASNNDEPLNHRDFFSTSSNALPNPIGSLFDMGLGSLPQYSSILPRNNQEEQLYFQELQSLLFSKEAEGSLDPNLSRTSLLVMQAANKFASEKSAEILLLKKQIEMLYSEKQQLVQMCNYNAMIGQFNTKISMDNERRLQEEIRIKGERYEEEKMMREKEGKDYQERMEELKEINRGLGEMIMELRERVQKAEVELSKKKNTRKKVNTGQNEIKEESVEPSG